MKNYWTDEDAYDIGAYLKNIRRARHRRKPRARREKGNRNEL